jgi:hypothetical protein
MTTEEKLQQIIGAQVLTICALQTQVEDLQKRVAELEPPQAETAKVSQFRDKGV